MDVIKMLKPIAEQNAIGVRDVFDDVVGLLYNRICADSLDYRSVYMSVSYDTDSLVSYERYGQSGAAALIKPAVQLVEIMKGTELFCDALTDIYGHLLSGERGQFMTPAKLASAAAAFMQPQESAAGRLECTEPTCGTGALVLAHLQSIYRAGGKQAVGHVHYRINDIDIRLARVAMLQIMFHSIHHECPLAEIMVFCGDTIKNYNSGRRIFRARINDVQNVIV
ncbi:hypothetical protein [Agrobacterium pusense]|uniref:hypothetical protein n=1 Tax=Agrobacterium pusense TaxID=648995 RepID=UPI002F410E8F